MSEKKKILIVDDDPSYQHYLKMVLGGSGYKTIAASTTDLGYELFKDERPDVVVASNFMPGTSGTELVEMFRKYESGKAKKKAVMILMSSVPVEEDLWLRAGANDFYDKKMTGSQLIKMIRDPANGEKYV